LAVGVNSPGRLRLALLRARNASSSLELESVQVDFRNVDLSVRAECDHPDVPQIAKYTGS
jgi:hypothetical protein